MKWNICKILNKNILDDNLLLSKKQLIIDKDYHNFGAADPFIFKNYIFAELMDPKLNSTIIEGRENNKYIRLKLHKGGYIAVAKNENPLIFKPILKDKFHFSYPHIFEYNNDIYMIPETYQSLQLRLYKCKDFPYTWELEKVLFEVPGSIDLESTKRFP